MCDANETVTAWDDYYFSADSTLNGIVTKNYESYRFAPNNIRVIYEVSFADYLGAHFLDKWYNLHGHGVFDIRYVESTGN